MHARAPARHARGQAGAGARLRGVLGAARLHGDDAAAAAAPPLHLGAARGDADPPGAGRGADRRARGPRGRAGGRLRGDARATDASGLHAARGHERVERPALVRARSGRAPDRGHVGLAAAALAGRVTVVP